MEKNYSFHVQGMHCASCVVLTETELSDIPEVSSAKASLKNNSVEVVANFNNLSDDEVRERLSAALIKHGYNLSSTTEKTVAKQGEFSKAVPLALVAIAIFLGIQKLGIVNLINGNTVDYGTAFGIGIIASLSTCMAVVGGLVLSLSATYAREKSNLAHYMFHAGRLIGFFLLGGVIGALGGIFQLGALGTSLLSIAVALLMIILGLNLLDVFPWAKRLQLTTPRAIGRGVLGLRSLNSSIAPFLIGALTFFLPCGFTQSMQLYALTTHSFWTGAGIMLSFALGTLPILGLLSFGSSAAEKLRNHSSLIFKTMGLIVLFFACFNIINSLAALGVIDPIFNF